MSAEMEDVWAFQDELPVDYICGYEEEIEEHEAQRTLTDGWRRKEGVGRQVRRCRYCQVTSICWLPIHLLTLSGQYFFQFTPNGKPNTTNTSSLRTLQWKDDFGCVLPSFYKIVCLAFFFPSMSFNPSRDDCKLDNSQSCIGMFWSRYPHPSQFTAPDSHFLKTQTVTWY